MNGIHENSVLAYHEGREELFSKRQRKVLEVLRASRDPLTDREIMIRLGFAEPNQVRPRINELLGAGVLTGTDSIRCPITGKTVRRVKIAPREIQAEFEISEVMTPAVVANLKQRSA